MTVYLDGDAQSDTETSSEGFDYRYWGWTGSSSDYFDGAMDEVRIYNKALTAAEVKRNYNAGKRSHR